MRKIIKYPLKCSTKEYTRFGSNAELRNFVFAMYKTKYSELKRTITNTDTGIKITFDRTGAKKTSFGGSMYAKKAALVGILDKICRYGYLLSVGSPKEKDVQKGVLCFFNFKVNVIIDDEINVVKFSIRLKKDGTFHYHIDTPLSFENKKKS